MNIDETETVEGSEEPLTTEGTQESEQQQEASESTEETSSEASGEGTSKDEEWLVPGRFRTAEDLRRSYSELESAYSRRGNELHKLKTLKEKPQVNPEEEVRDFAEAVKRNPVEAVRNIIRNETREIKQETKQVRFESEYKRLMQDSKFAELEPIMTNIAQEYDDILTDDIRNDPRLLHVLYFAAKGVKADEDTKKVAQAAQTQGEKNAMKKVKAQVEGVSGTKGHRPLDVDKMTAAQLKEAIMKGKVKP